MKAWAASEPVLGKLVDSGLALGLAAARFGLHLMKESQTGDAATVFRAAISLKPGDADLWTNLGVALDRTGLGAEAAGALEESVALKREQPDIWLFLGVVRGKLGDAAGAEEAYRISLAQAPGSAAAWQCLGLLKEQQRDYLAAIDCLKKCVRFDRATPAISANLGKLYYQLGRVQEARDAYAAAVHDEPHNAHYQRMLERARFLSESIEGTSVDDALASYRPLAANPQDDHRERLAWLEVAAGVLTGLGHRDAAIRLSKKRLELAPQSVSAKYLLDALSGEHLDRAPTGYVVENFDAFAERYDAQMVSVLGYDVPEQLVSYLRALPRPGDLFDALDAGCGTGLCGPLLRPFCRWLIGVDLSGKMLEQAERRGAYDSLVHEELTSFLNRQPAAFDLIVAADVLLYFGDLTGLFAGAALSLRQAGLFALSTEWLEEPGYRVLSSGRFAHNPEYVRSIARAAFEEVLGQETTLRLDAKARVRGNLFLFRRRGA